MPPKVLSDVFDRVVTDTQIVYRLPPLNCSNPPIKQIAGISLNELIVHSVDQTKWIVGCVQSLDQADRSNSHNQLEN